MVARWQQEQEAKLRSHACMSFVDNKMQNIEFDCEYRSFPDSYCDGQVEGG